MENKGKITQVIGAVLDIKYEEGNLPEINEAIRIKNGDKVLTVEVSPLRHRQSEWWESDHRKEIRDLCR